MDESLQNIGIKQLRSIVPNEIVAGVEDDFFILNVDSSEDVEFLTYPLRFDGYMSIFCKKGSINAEVNLHHFTVTDKTLLILVPGNILKISILDDLDDENMSFVAMAVSKDFISSMRFDFNTLFNESINLLSNPCFKLDDDEMSVGSEYLDLLVDVANRDFPYKQEAVSSLMTSLFYYLGGKWTQKLQLARDAVPAQSARVKLLFDRFMTDVTEYHSRERKMSFYADRLNLSPKYLSKLIRDVSGRSGPEWIDAFVILEAKNLLKYSELSIKEIVYGLNFPNQSVFYKFFKAHTGMTPSEYRNS